MCFFFRFFGKYGTSGVISEFCIVLLLVPDQSKDKVDKRVRLDSLRFAHVLVR
jgi:hypothetical protein